jgi:uncharacterized membrane protein YsdA (DUF1294 family)/cold shock CspA family protein
MRYQGRISDWRDDKGFGFVTPNGGGQSAFVHIKSFVDRRRRPLGNELVSYELVIDAKGRAQAERVAFVDDRSRAAGRAGSSGTSQGDGVSVLLAPLFLAAVSVAAAVGKLPFAVPGIYLVASILALAAYGIDKSAARADRWRVREDTLHLFALLGGWPGALLAQRWFRHKTRKASFRFVFWITVIANCVTFGWLLTPAGGRFVRSVMTLM